MSDVETRIRSLLAEMQDAVAANDLGALDALLDEEAVLFGTAVANTDRRESLDYLSAVVAQPGTIGWTWDTVLPIVDESELLVFAVVGTVGFDEGGAGSVTERDAFRLTIVAVWRDERWRLRHFHGSVPDAE